MDAFQGHRHGSPWYQAPTANLTHGDNTSFGSESRSGTDRVTGVSGADYSNRYRPFTTSPKTDGTNGTPRISSETRGKNANVVYLIKY
jgi:hypothetical protein